MPVMRRGSSFTIRVPLLALDLVAEIFDGLADLLASLAQLFPRGADGALAAAFRLEVSIARELSGLFLDVALGLFGFALQLVLVHGWPLLPGDCASEVPASFVVSSRWEEP